jgi:hypothetical protein
MDPRQKLTCAFCGGNLNRLTIYEKGVLKRASCWCINQECTAFGVQFSDAVHSEEVTTAQNG